MLFTAKSCDCAVSSGGSQSHLNLEEKDHLSIPLGKSFGSCPYKEGQKVQSCSTNSRLVGELA